MKIHELTPSSSSKNKKRVGRGISAGGGKTAGRGTKGQKARTGKKLRAGFEGGQTPLMRRIPQLKGFRSHRAKSQIVYTDNLSMVKGSSIDNFKLADAGLIADPYHSVKILSRGDAPKGTKISTQQASAQAIQNIEKLGGKFERVETPMRQKASDDKEASSATVKN